MKLINVIESYVAAHVAPLEDTVKAEFIKFVEYVRGEEAKIEAEIAHLTGRGYTVVPPLPGAAGTIDASLLVSGSIAPASAAGAATTSSPAPSA
jgi:hypothetical protein